MRKFLCFVSLLVMMFMQAGCSSDDDERIPSDYGGVRELLTGQWFVNDTKRVLSFTDDGYYTDSSLPSTRKMKWKLEEFSGDDKSCYYLWLGDDYYELEILSYDHLYLKYEDGILLELKRDGSFKDEDDDQPSSSGGKIVSKITVGSGNYIEQTIKFSYDKNGRVSSADYGGADEIICGPQEYHIFYNIKGSEMTISLAYSGSSKIIETLPGKGSINSQGYLESQYFENYLDEIESGKYSICRYEHDEKGRILSYSFYGDPYDRYPSVCTYEWRNGCIMHFNGNPGGACYNENPTYTNIENKANLNLNWMIFDEMFSEDIFGLALCGYISTKEKYLIDNGVKWVLDKNGYVVQAMYKGYTYNIEYK